MNNLALFVTHNIFLNKNEIDLLSNGKSIKTIGHCVPVWVDAKTGKTTEPAGEIFCRYTIHNTIKKQKEIKIINKKQYEIFVPNKNEWKSPEKVDFNKLSLMSSEERQIFIKKREKWWFDHPKPPCIDNLKNGYLRFEIKKIKRKIENVTFSAQHVVEMAEMSRLEKSLTT